VNDLVCGCYPQLGRVDCIGLNLRNVPTFQIPNGHDYWYLDLQRNSIKVLSDADLDILHGFKVINLRENPVDCQTLPHWRSLVTDCPNIPPVTVKDLSTVSTVFMGPSNPPSQMRDTLADQSSSDKAVVPTQNITSTYYESSSEINDMLILIILVVIFCLSALLLSVYILWLKLLKRKQRRYHLLPLNQDETEWLDLLPLNQDETDLINIGDDEEESLLPQMTSREASSPSSNTDWILPSPSVSAITTPSPNNRSIGSNDTSVQESRNISRSDSGISMGYARRQTIPETDMDTSQCSSRVTSFSAKSSLQTVPETSLETSVEEEDIQNDQDNSTNASDQNTSNDAEKEDRNEAENTDTATTDRTHNRYDLRPNPQKTPKKDDYHYYK
jgi:hypothetical protein